LEAREYCLREGLSYLTFSVNRRKLRRRLSAAPETAPEFVEISPSVLFGGSTAKLEIGRLTLTLSDCSANDLCAILKSLGAESCRRKKRSNSTGLFSSTRHVLSTGECQCF
jgi:hypothetical protein